MVTMLPYSSNSISFFIALTFTVTIDAQNSNGSPLPGILRDIEINPFLDCDTDPNKYADFEEGADFFEQRFQALYQAVRNATIALNQVDVQKNTQAPTSTVREFTAVIASTAQQHGYDIRERVVLMGKADELIFCFKSARLLLPNYYNCDDSLRFSYQTGSGYWTLRRHCSGWVVLYTHVQSRLLSNSQYLKTIVTVEVDLSAVDINQCGDSTDLVFRGTHLCPPKVSTCVNKEGQGFQADTYECVCTNNCSTCAPTSGKTLIRLNENTTDSICKIDELTLVPERRNLLVWSSPDLTLIILLCINSFLILVCLILALVVICLKAEKVIQSAKVMTLELILIGAIIIYATVWLNCFYVSETSYLLAPWFRELGFVCVYGAIVLKTYKGLAEFQTRKARRVHVRDIDLLKYWLLCLLIVVVYMAAWTAINLTPSPTLWRQVTLSETDTVFKVTAWNYVTQAAELFFVAYGLYISYRLRSAGSLFWESRYMAAALTIEFLFSLAYYILSDTMVFDAQLTIIIQFIHTHLTITPTILIIIAPKLHYIRKPPPDSAFWNAKPANTTDLVDFRTNAKSPGNQHNGEIDLDEMNIAEMNPEDIRSELRRVYEQLQAYRVKVMRYENPHIHSKRGSSRNKLPFYKLTKHGFRSRGHARSGQNEVAELQETPVSENPEEVPLTGAKSLDNQEINEQTF